MKTKQFFTNEYLASCKNMTSNQIIDFLNNFMNIHTRTNDPTKLISIKIKESLLLSFKNKAHCQGVKYQTQIKRIMEDWLLS